MKTFWSCPSPYILAARSTAVSEGREIICEIERHGRKAFAFPDRGACGDALVRLARRGDRIVIMGARDDSLSEFAHELLRRLALTRDSIGAGEGPLADGAGRN